MDKPFSPHSGMHSSKRGFALIVTLSVLAVIIALTGVLVGYLDIARKDASGTKALLQANLYFNDMKMIIKKFKDKKTLYGVLYTAPVPLQSEDGRFALTLGCKPLGNGVNINWLAAGNREKMTTQYAAAEKIFEVLVEKYEIENPIRLEEMLLEEIDGAKTTNTDEQSRLRRKNGIISYQQFRQVLSRYQFEVDDEKVGSVPWEKYFVFNPVSKVPEENLIEGDYLSQELLAALFDIDPEILKEEWMPGEGALKKLLGDNGILFDAKLFSKGFMSWSYCEVDFDFEDARYRFAFTDIEGEVKDFEFYGKQ